MLRRFAAAAVVLCTFACGKQTFVTATFLQSPAVPNPANPAQSFPSGQVLTTWFGTIDTSNPTKIDPNIITGVADATATVSFHHRGTGGADVDADRVLPLVNQGTGTYQLDSANQSLLTFENDTPYTLVLTTAGAQPETFGARLTPGPVDDLQEIATSTCSAFARTASRCKSIALGQPLTVTRTAALAGQLLLPAFVLIAQVDPMAPGAAPTVTYDTVPRAADKLLKFLLSDGEYRWRTMDIPATAFPQSGYYVITLLTARTGKVSDNTFIGSIALAAAGSAGLVQVP